MESLDDTHTESQTATTKLQQTPAGTNGKGKQTTAANFVKLQFPNDDIIETSRAKDDGCVAKADGDHLLESILLSNGKPLKGILKHRHRTDTKRHTHSERIVGVLECVAEISISNEVESSKNTDSVADDSEPVAPPHSGKTYLY